MVVPDVLLVAQLAAGQPIDPDLDEAGTPRRALLAVDISAADRLSPADLRVVINRLTTSLVPVVAVGSVEGSAQRALVQASTFGLVTAGEVSDVDLELDRMLVPVPDVVEAWSALVAMAAAAPRTAITLARTLRQTEVLGVPDALAAESAAYSTLLAGPEFAHWLALRRPPRPPVPGEVRLERRDDVLVVTMDRPARRNAVNAEVRDALYEGFSLLDADPDVRAEFRAAGPDFSFGGDLHEFGSAPDPATAHVIRLTRSVGALIASHRDRVTAYVHGACYGAGCELPAFAGRVVATADARFALPEISLGLIPGAGGTVSVTGRIGRWRTAWLALSGARIDAPTALAWGLVDELSP